MSHQICKICEKGRLVPCEKDNNGVMLLFSVCTYCKAEQANAQQLRINKEAMQNNAQTCLIEYLANEILKQQHEFMAENSYRSSDNVSSTVYVSYDFYHRLMGQSIYYDNYLFSEFMHYGTICGAKLNRVCESNHPDFVIHCRLIKN